MLIKKIVPGALGCIRMPARAKQPIMLLVHTFNDVTNLAFGCKLMFVDKGV